jgi:glutaredoxin
MGIDQVRIYTISTCVHCRALKKMLEQYRIPYEFTDVDLMPKEERKSFIAAIQQFNEKKIFPIVMIGNKAIVGFQEQVIKKELGIE